jgi:hypothetical protein
MSAATHKNNIPSSSYIGNLFSFKFLKNGDAVARYHSLQRQNEACGFFNPNSSVKVRKMNYKNIQNIDVLKMSVGWWEQAGTVATGSFRDNRSRPHIRVETPH